ncbi:hypothetical protein EV421DRAFT_1735496 [Armillaria borealis]|uniref:Uncharacterized protein n=1 Tax=Armillaria borealis TaxID=47425 RepID=A0AA39MRN9_9AGAR|nr:hypothetical protein EV421DRAFT_1735496 [Armillaria borealis]
MSAPQTQYAPTQSSSVLGGQIVGRSERQAAPPAAVKLRLDLNLEVEIAIQAKVNGDITLSLLKCAMHMGDGVAMQSSIQVVLFSPSTLVYDVMLPNPERLKFYDEKLSGNLLYLHGTYRSRR